MRQILLPVPPTARCLAAIALLSFLALAGCHGTTSRCAMSPVPPAVTPSPLSQTPAPTSSLPSDPLTPFARLLPGEWRLTLASGSKMVETWSWGPGRRSIVRETFGHDGGGNPWRSIGVTYADPHTGEIRTFGLSPDIPGLGRSASEGVVRFEDGVEITDTAMDQPGHPGAPVRQLRWTRTFDGPDRYLSRLEESTEGGPYQTLGEWTYTRSTVLSSIPPLPEEDLRPAGPFAPLAPLLAHAWESRTGEDAAPLRTTFTWVPLVGAIHVRSSTSGESGGAALRSEAFLYRQPGDDSRRALILGADGAVRRGRWTAVEGGSLHLDLDGDDGERLEVRLEAGEGTLRERGWSVRGEERTLRHERTHRPVANDAPTAPRPSE